MKSPHIQLITLMLICCLGQFGMDIVAPSLPAISHQLNISTNLAQWSMVIYLLSFSISPILYGPVADTVGRKPPLIIGLVLMLIGSLMCTMASNSTWLIIARLIQGLGGGACVLWRGIFRDYYKGDELSKIGSYLGMLIIFVVPAAPLLGGTFQITWGWHASFVFMSLYGLVSIFCTLFILDETLKQSSSLSTSLFKPYIEILKHPTFLWYVFCVCMTFGAFFTWSVVGPILWINQLHYSILSFGIITFLASASMITLASIINGKWVTQFTRPTMLRIGWTFMIMAGLFFILGYLVFGIHAFTLFVPIALLYFGATFVFPNVFASAFTPFGHIAGYAAAVYALGQSIGAFILGAIMSHLPDATPIPLGLSIIIATTLAWIAFECCCHRQCFRRQQLPEIHT